MGEQQELEVVTDENNSYALDIPEAVGTIIKIKMLKSAYNCVRKNREAKQFRKHVVNVLIAFKVTNR